MSMSTSTQTTITEMNRTLQQLKETVDRLIEQQGAEASCAALIFTKEDVFTMDENGNEVYYDEETSVMLGLDFNRRLSNFLRLEFFDRSKPTLIGTSSETLSS